MTTPARPVAALESALRERGLLPDPLRTLPEPGPGRPWFVGALLGVSGWLAGLFALGFVALAFRPEGTAGFTLLGLVLLGVSLAVFRTGQGAFTEQGALALSIAGHALLGAAVFHATDSGSATAAAVAALQAGWVVVVPARVPRVLSSLFACVAAGVAASLLVGASRGPTARGDEAVALAPALLGWIAVWVPIAVLARTLVATEVRWMSRGLQPLLRPVLTGLLVALALASPASHPLDVLAAWGPEGPGRTSWLALWPLLSLGAAIWALWLAHRVRSGALMGAAIAGALLHVFHFYMVLGATLLQKAAVMLALGVALLAGAAALGRRASP